MPYAKGYYAQVQREICLIDTHTMRLLLHLGRRLDLLLLDPIHINRNDPTHVHSIRHASGFRCRFDFLKHFRLLPGACNSIQITIENRVLQFIVRIGIVVGIPWDV